MHSGIPCDLCGGCDSTPHLKLPGATPYGLLRCRACGLVYLDPRPDPVEMAAYYSGDYYTSRPPAVATTGLRQRLKVLAYRARCDDPAAWRGVDRATMPLARALLGWRAHRRVPRRATGRLLDVGCGNGEQAAWLRDNLPGWDVEGVEVNRHAADVAHAVFGLRVHVGSLPELGLAGEHYDMVSFWHSLEHTYSPRENLREAFRLLRPGGWVGIEVPNAASPEARRAASEWYHLAVPFHLYHFTPDTLSRLLEQCGFALHSVEVLRGDVGLIDLAARRAPTRSRGHALAARAHARTLGRLSPWGIRIYAVKPC